MTDTDVTFLHYYRSCHDLYLLFIPASLHGILFAGPDQTTGLHPGESQPPRQVQVQPACAARPGVVVFMTGLSNDDPQYPRVVHCATFLLIFFGVKLHVE